MGYLVIDSEAWQPEEGCTTVLQEGKGKRNLDALDVTIEVRKVKKIHIFEYVACMCPDEYDRKVCNTFRLIHSYEQGKMWKDGPN